MKIWGLVGHYCSYLLPKQAPATFRYCCNCARLDE